MPLSSHGDMTMDDTAGIARGLGSDLEGFWAWDLAADRVRWSTDLPSPRDDREVGDRTFDDWLTHVHVDHRARVEATLRAAAERPQSSFRLSYRLNRRQLEVECWGRRIMADDGSAAQLVGVVREACFIEFDRLRLRERVKELNCVYRVLELTSDRVGAVGPIYQQIVELLPPSLLHSEIGVARIIIGDEEYRSAGWDTPWASRSRPILCDGHAAGRIEVGYAGPLITDDDATIFLAEEDEMLGAVAAHICRMIEERALSGQLLQAERLTAVGELTGGLAHDFNNLLTVIIGSAEDLRDRLAEPSFDRNLAEMVLQAAQRGADLTRQLLAFARRQALAPRPTDVPRLIMGMETILRRSLGEQVQLRLHRDTGLKPALVDPGQLEHAILNLCINARDAMPQGGRLSIDIANALLAPGVQGWEAEMVEGDYLRIAVSDTGSGMTGEVMARAFEPFFTTKDVGQGSGLGLSMVFGFVRQSHGYVRLASEPGQGTTVTLHLPCFGAPGELPPPPVRQPGRGGSERILAVEDDDLLRSNVAAQLRTLGYAVTVAANGPEALRILYDDSDYDLLFTDIIMPEGMNGIDLAREALTINDRLRVLFTSGYPEATIIRQGRIDEAVNLLQKPYRRKELAERLRALLDAPARSPFADRS